jgi:hypothetical protein
MTIRSMSDQLTKDRRTIAGSSKCTLYTGKKGLTSWHRKSLLKRWTIEMYSHVLWALLWMIATDQILSSDCLTEHSTYTRIKADGTPWKDWLSNSIEDSDRRTLTNNPFRPVPRCTNVVYFADCFLERLNTGGPVTKPAEESCTRRTVSSLQMCQILQTFPAIHPFRDFGHND